MAAYSRGNFGRSDHRNADHRNAVSSAHFSQDIHGDKAPESIRITGKNMSVKKAESQLAKLAEELFGSPADTDKLLVAALILLLLKEGADPKLILALGYIFI